MANLLSWSAWTPYILSENGLGIWHFRFPSLLGTSQLAGMLPGAYLGPILSAFLVTAAADGRAGLRVWTGRLVKFGVSWRWYLAVLISVPAVLIIATLPLTDGDFRLPPVVTLLAYLPALVLQMVTTGLAEEPGWRDFALPRMQRRYGPVVGTLILGVLWGIWHLPLFLTEWGGWPHVDLLTPVEFVVSATALSFVMTWVFNRTGESLPLAMLAHTSVNNFFSVVGSQMFPQLTSRDGMHALLIGSVVVTIVLLVATRGRLGYPPSVETSVAA
ncbi:CPBP family intramembrane metalloprotease [Amycolatopsis cynarae]|uniref:CPBP family intramembrane metalloprotease n=1 Tax=Amycolatopsis cynarae TaxID=2995223 RepID=A0ABY7AUZ6_9PSEU|nr:CPBP family intramembrane glutamic endopeptidase [Amycolatopsis sp. HUAS 11-8]WAL63797.1 CPBP family intramembrane metalloprotease [Amycolatopsis sp. HUAS 11-8]